MPTMPAPATLFILCGKMAAGKSTLARELAAREDAVLLVQDELLGSLFPGEFVDLMAFIERYGRLTKTLGPHIAALLTRGVPVVLDFAANTRSQRAWFRQLLDASGAGHELHYVDASDALCKRQLAERSKGYPPGTKWTTDADFDEITAYFQPPADDEGFTVVHHPRG
jgi:predicted kinase